MLSWEIVSQEHNMLCVFGSDERYAMILEAPLLLFLSFHLSIYLPFSAFLFKTLLHKYLVCFWLMHVCRVLSSSHVMHKKTRSGR